MNRPFSHSSLSTFQQCPARFKFIYLDKISKPYDGIESFVGRRVHELLEFLYDEIQQRRLPMFDEIDDLYLDNWKKKFHKDVIIIKKGYSFDHYFNIGRDCVRQYYRKNQPFSQPAKETEYELLFKLDDEDDFQIKGIIDRLDYLGQGRWEIHDYKTSTRLMSQFEADKSRQLALYQIGLEKNLKEIVSVELVFHFLRQGVEVTTQRTPRQLNNLKIKTKNLIHTIIDRVNNSGSFEPRESALCDWCFFWEECEAKTRHNPFVNSEVTA